MNRTAPGAADTLPGRDRDRGTGREVLTGVLVLAALAAASHGWFLTRLGFYLDDWGPLWVFRHEGFAGWAARAQAIQQPLWSVAF